MNIPCLIAITNPDGSVTAIKALQDGQVSIAALTLEKYYTEEKTIRELLDLGDVLVLSHDIKTTKLVASTVDEMYGSKSEYTGSTTYKNTEDFSKQPIFNRYLFVTKYETWYSVESTQQYSVKMTRLLSVLLKNDAVSDKDEIYTLIQEKERKRLYGQFQKILAPKEKYLHKAKI